MIKAIKIISGIIVIVIAAYNLFSQNYRLMPYLMLFLAIFMFITGISEFQKNQKTNGVITVLASIFILFVFIYTV